jgi:phosphoribosylanthranilate isomerase
LRIKICGITRYEDARTAVSLGVDALGFIFFPQSPRYISPFAAKDIIEKLPPFVSKVGVFVNENPHRVVEVIQTAGLDTIQFHGDEPPQYCDMFPLPVIKAFSVRDGDFNASILSAYKTSAHLLDTWDPERRGGSGNTFDWSAAVDACNISDAVILSGGLNPINIGSAIRTVRPYAVDVNSGVELNPGIKNPYKMREFVSIIRKYTP